MQGDVAYLAIGRRIEVVDLRPEAGRTTPDGDELPAMAMLMLPGEVSHVAATGSTLVVGMESERELWARRACCWSRPQRRRR